VSADGRGADIVSRVSDYLAPHFDRAALVLVDVQNDFIDGAMPVAGTREILDRLAGLAAGFRAVGRPVAHLIRLYEPGGSDVDAVRRADVEAGAQVVAPGTVGAEIPAALLPGARPISLQTDTLLAGRPQQLSDREAVVYKPRWSAFYRTDLERWLRARDVDTVVVAGCNLPNCPRATLFDASERDLRAVLVTDAVSQATPERLADLQLIGVKLLTADEVAAALS
jgi:nicotinamidase-related amidase